VDTTCLLVDYLSDVLTLSYTEKAVFCAVNFHKLEETSLSARIYGRAVEGFDEEIKAVTYHGANVRQNQKKQWETCIIFDI
jgi:SHS2 domain-containing protein